MVQTRSATVKHQSNEARSKSTATTTEVLPVMPVEETRQRGTKRRRLQEIEGDASAKKRRRGKPEKLCQLNLDVLFLLAAYVEPVDLLNLSRTCKSLRKLLMDKSSTFVWKTARRQVEPPGLPDCPDDLTEPQYANLVFYARCHHCGKHAPTILWYIRRRYCPTCREKRLRRLQDCDILIRDNTPIPVEFFRANKDFYGSWVDVDQMKSFLSDFRSRKPSSAKDEFLKDMRQLRVAIHEHARKCELWQEERGRARRRRLEARRAERETGIFEHLKQAGFECEIDYYGRASIRREYESAFKTSKPLTDREWDRLSPSFVDIMKEFRVRRLERVLYPRRRGVVRDKYDLYVQETLSDAPSAGKHIVPYFINAYPPIDAIIKAPEGTSIDDVDFTSAFAQMTMSVGDWRRKVSSELAALMHTPPSTSTDTVEPNQDKTRRTCKPTQSAVSAQTIGDKFNLACALFSIRHRPDYGLYAYPGLLFLPSHCNYLPYETDEASTTIKSWAEKFIDFRKEAVDVIRACGLDPDVVTIDDMEHRNARLICLACEGPRVVRTWASAVRHVSIRHEQLPHDPNKPRWYLVDDNHLDAIKAVERVPEETYPADYSRCLLCRPRVGDAWRGTLVSSHLSAAHKIETSEIRRGVHYEPLELLDVTSAPAGEVEMVEEAECVTFREVCVASNENQKHEPNDPKGKALKKKSPKKKTSARKGSYS